MLAGWRWLMERPQQRNNLQFQSQRTPECSLGCWRRQCFSSHSSTHWKEVGFLAVIPAEVAKEMDWSGIELKSCTTSRTRQICLKFCSVCSLSRISKACSWEDWDKEMSIKQTILPPWLLFAIQGPGVVWFSVDLKGSKKQKLRT